VNPEQFARLREILLTLPRLAQAERNAYIAEACGGDRDLEQQVFQIIDKKAPEPQILELGALDKLLQSAIDPGLVDDQVYPMPTRIGHYDILAVLGEGGMGVVFRALQREPVRREVALKLVRAGAGSPQILQRFEMERRTLASMEHPHIATLLDVGADRDGTPYFVMELVRGVPITEFCKQECFSLKQRVELFRVVCLAVQHAHQKGIIHRDLKPSNILVSLQDDAPYPKLIDFGVARALHDSEEDLAGLTREGQVIGTREYMSPEQAEGQVAALDTRSDVFSLGAVLCELVTGEFPLPRKLGGQKTTSGRVDRDLQTIMLKALEEQPDHRYTSAGALAEDLERYLTNQPIVARPPSALYQLRKLIARHRTVAAVVVVLPVLLAAWAITMSALRNRTIIEARKVEEISGFLQGMLHANHIEGGGRDVKLADVLAACAGRIDELGDQPEVQATLRQTFGESYRTLGLHDEAEAHLRDALATYRQGGSKYDADRATILEKLSEVLRAKGKLAEPESLLRRSLDLRLSMKDTPPQYIARSMNLLARTLASLGRADEAEPFYRQGLEHRIQALGDTSEAVASSRNDLAAFLWRQSRYAEAAPLYRAALDTYLRIHGERHTDVASMIDNLGLLLRDTGKLHEAESLHAKAFGIREELLGGEHQLVAVSCVNLGACLESQERYDEAVSLSRRAVDILKTVFGDEHAWTANALHALGRQLAACGAYPEAERFGQEALEIRRRILPPEHPATKASKVIYASILLDGGRAEEAERHLIDVLPRLQEALPATSWKIGQAQNLLGRCMAAQGNQAAAESLFSEARATLLTAPILVTRKACRRTAALYDEWGNTDEADFYRSSIVPATDSQ